MGRSTIAALLVAIVAVGCSDGVGEEGATSEAVESEPVATEEVEGESEPVAAEEESDEPLPANVRYDSVYDLRDRIEDAGIECTGWSVLATPRNAIERATCTDAIVVSIHSDAAEVQRSLDAIAEMVVDTLEMTSGHVIGPNWSVNCGGEAETCSMLRDALGGEVDMREP